MIVLNSWALLKPPCRLGMQCPHHYFIEPHIHLADLRRRECIIGGHLAGKQLVEHHTQRVDVGAMIDILRRRICSGAM